jgi:hypothetical protein
LLSKNGDLEWQKTPLPSTQQTLRHNVIREQQGLTSLASVCGESPFSSLKLFITHEITSHIVKCTNIEGQQIFEQQWKDTNIDEMYAFIGLLLLAGVYRCKNSSIVELWSKQDGRAVFNQSMALKRFLALRRCIRFDVRLERGHNKLAPIHQIFDKFATRCKSLYKPGAYLTIDEQLVSFRGRCPFKMYIPTKPGKYGIKVWVLCDASNSYCCNLQIYVGKTGNNAEIGQASRVVLELTDHLTGSGRHITADNFFTSVNLVRNLLGRQLTYTGTMRKNKPEIPPQMLASRSRQLYSSLFGFQRNMTLVSYVPKKNRAVILLSSLHHQPTVNVNNESKPEIIEDYNSWKSGVDTLDQLVRTYSCKRKTRRWPFALFCNIVDIAAYNAYVLFRHVHPNYQASASHRRRLFLLNLSKSMLPSPQVTDSCNIPSHQVIPKTVQSNEKRVGRCHLCPRSVDKKTANMCEKCGKNVCKEHFVIRCNSCA